MNFKICQNKLCRKAFYKTEKTRHTWHNKETCNVNCCRLWTNQRRKEQRKDSKEHIESVRTDPTPEHVFPKFRFTSVTDKWLTGYKPEYVGVWVMQ